MFSWVPATDGVLWGRADLNQEIQGCSTMCRFVMQPSDSETDGGSNDNL